MQYQVSFHGNQQYNYKNDNIPITPVEGYNTSKM